VENPSDYFDSWMKSQQQAFAVLCEQAQQMQSYYQNAVTASDNPFANWSKVAFQAFPIGADANLTKDTFSKTLYGNEAIQKLFELWQPLLNAMRDKSMDPASYGDLTDPDKIKQLIGKLFNFDLDAMSQLQKQAAQYTDVYQQFSKPWADAAKSQSSNFMQGDLQPEALMLQAQAMYNMFDSATGKMFGTPAVGKDREKMELLSQCAKAMSVFATNNIEYHKLMQTTGQAAMQDVANALAAKFKAGEKIEKFDEFFALWIDTNEKAFNKLFQTKAFSQKRNALTEAGFSTRKLYNQIVENQLAELPIARRSEMDEVYKIIYELRKQIKSLESQVLELKSQDLKSPASNNKEQPS
jgi:BMFP domain-containing protein YqiC